MPRVFVSGPRDMKMQNNPGNARVCPGLQVPMHKSVIYFIHLIISAKYILCKANTRPNMEQACKHNKTIQNTGL